MTATDEPDPHDPTLPGEARMLWRLHWLCVPLVLLQYLFQRPMRESMAAVAAGRGVDALGFLVTTAHSLFGILLLALLLWRLRLRQPLASRLRAYNPLARWAHRALYALLIWMALTGIGRYFLGIEALAPWHGAAKWPLALLLVLHLLGALRMRLDRAPVSRGLLH